MPPRPPKRDLRGQKPPKGGRKGRQPQSPRQRRPSPFSQLRSVCCKNEALDSTGDCDSAAWPKGKAFPHILAFAADQEKWLKSYTQAWKIATENGHADLLNLNPDLRTPVILTDCGAIKNRRQCRKKKGECAWRRSSEKPKGKRKRAPMVCGSK